MSKYICYVQYSHYTAYYDDIYGGRLHFKDAKRHTLDECVELQKQFAVEYRTPPASGPQLLWVHEDEVLTVVALDQDYERLVVP